MRKLILFCLVAIIMLGGCGADRGASKLPETEDAPPYGTPEYAVDKYARKQDIEVEDMDYELIDDYLFAVISIRPSHGGNSLIGAKNKDGNYKIPEWELPPPAVLPIYTHNIIYFALLHKFGDDYVFEYALGTGKVYEETYDDFGITEVDKDKVELYDQDGNKLTKVTAEGTPYAAFFDIRQDFDEDFEIYAMYEGEKYPLVDKAMLEPLEELIETQ